jgi:fermentation-respiration switch protein FrsA (DUF1100 family)
MVAVVTATLLWLFLPRPAAKPDRFLAHRGRIVNVDTRDSVTATGRTLRMFEIESTTGLRVRGLLSIPEGGGPFSAVILQGGLATSQRALLFVPEPGPRVLASMEYPYRMPHRAGFFTVLCELPRMRRSADRAVAGLFLVLDYLESLPQVDPSRTVIVGGSLGVPFATLAGAIEPRFEGVALLFGGGDLAQIAEARVPFRSSLLRNVSKMLLRPWLDPVDPVRFVSRIAPRPVLLVNGRRDTDIPAASVALLHQAAREPKTVVWVDTPHRVQGNAAFSEVVAGAVWDWMEGQGWGE